MSAAEIQKFLNTQGAACRGNGCLKNIRLNTRSFNADPYCKGKYQGANNEPVSQIIYKISQACQINPKVLLVTIQKEQAGITQNLTTAKQNKLTGYGCPDGRPCSEQYYGVQNQIYQAAHQFQRYRIKSPNYSFRSGITANIQFSYQSGCGSSKVKLENQATASLYNYTPYQPKLYFRATPIVVPQTVTTISSKFISAGLAIRAAQFPQSHRVRKLQFLKAGTPALPITPRPKPPRNRSLVPRLLAATLTPPKR